MSRFLEYLEERKQTGKGIHFVDIDQTIFKSFAKIHVVDKETGEVIKKLDNQEFNSYQLKQGEEFDFKEFKDANLFKQTSQPIKPVIGKIKRIIEHIKRSAQGSKVIFLTARADFSNKREFLQAFKEQEIDVDFKSNVYIERAGNLEKGTVPQKKEKIIMGYLKDENYRRVRMLDDYTGNLENFIQIADKVPQEIVDKVRDEYDIPESEPAMIFYAYHVGENGKVSQYGKKEVY